MSGDGSGGGKCPMRFFTRRGFLKSAGAGLGALALGSELGKKALAGESSTSDKPLPPNVSDRERTVPFYGARQAGITTHQQAHTYFAAFDLTTANRKDVIALLKAWTAASARMTQGETAAPMEKDLNKPGADSGDALGLGPSKLTLTFGFGPGLFSKDGKDRYGLLKHKPEALTDLPKFHGDQLVEAKCGGDLSVQACAEDPQVAFHAVRQLSRIAADWAQIRWAQTGFASASPDGSTPRNLMGFKDGTQQPDEKEHDRLVWAGAEGPSWMHGGTYLVTRRIRVALEHWDGTEVEFQEQVIGRHKMSGAPLGKAGERDELGLERADKDGNPVISDTAHVRLAAIASNGGAQMLRRGYSYNDGVSFVAERWPPWRQAMEYDAGLFFISYQSDPRKGFTRVFQNLAKLDALNQFVTHVGSGLFACPPGVAEGEYIGKKLFG
jgi:deferrochelatase/peroxidase EfeB